MPIQPGAEDFGVDGGPLALLLIHGFTGNPWSMRPWAEHHAAAGLTVRVPRLPGHGTSWQELNRTRWQDWVDRASRELTALRESGHSVVVAGLSAGGAVALRLAQTRPGDVAGLVLVNPSIADDDRRLRALPLLRLVLSSVGAIGNDIARPGADERAYPRTPLHALASLTRLWRTVRQDLARVRCPVLVLHSAVDHVVPELSTRVLVRGLVHAPVSQLELTRSFHVATLDHEAPLIFSRSLEFATALTTAAAAQAPEPVAG